MLVLRSNTNVVQTGATEMFSVPAGFVDMTEKL